MSVQNDDGLVVARQQLFNVIERSFREITSRPGVAIRRGDVTACYDQPDAVYRIEVETEERIHRYDVYPDARRNVWTRFRGQMTPAHYHDETEAGIYWLIERINAVAHLPAEEVERAR